MFATDATVLLHIVCSSGVAEQASNSESDVRAPLLARFASLCLPCKACTSLHTCSPSCMHVHLFSFLIAMVIWQYQRVEHSHLNLKGLLSRRTASGARQCIQQSDGGCDSTLL